MQKEKSEERTEEREGEKERMLFIKDILHLGKAHRREIKGDGGNSLSRTLLRKDRKKNYTEFYIYAIKLYVGSSNVDIRYRNITW